MNPIPIKKIITLILLAAMVTACAPQVAPTPAVESTPGGETRVLRVVATTNILADVVQQVAGDVFVVQSLIPMGSDSHSYQPTPRDKAMIADADLVFMVGAGLEEFMAGLGELADGNARVVDLSAGIELLKSEYEDKHKDEGEEGKPAEEEKHDEEGVDPHVWYDPNNVIVWVRSIEQALSEIDPENKAVYQANASAYIAQLEELDEWIQEQVAAIPQENRMLVTDHLLLGYFAHRYGFKQVGAIIPGYSTMAEPSAQEMAALEDAIRDLNVRAIFVGKTVNPQFAKRVAEDTGVQLVFFYTESLSAADGPASNYLDYIRYNVSVITEALK